MNKSLYPEKFTAYKWIIKIFKLIRTAIFNKKIFIAFVTFLISYVLLDTLIFALVPKQCKIFKNDPFLRFRNIPNSSCRHKTDDFDVVYKINSLALREEEISVEKKANSKRIIIVGDSLVFGHGVNVENTFVEQVERLLNKDSQGPLEIINAGIMGAAPTTEYLYLKYEGLKLKPDVVILGLYMNDFREEKALAKIVQRDDEGEVTGIPINEKTIRPLILENILKKYSFSYNLFRSKEEALVKAKAKLIARLKGDQIPKFAQGQEFEVGDIENDLFTITREIDDEKFNNLFKPVSDRLLEIKKLLDLNGVKFIVVVIPAGHQISDEEWAGLRKELKLPQIEYSRRVFSELEKLGNRENIMIFDLSKPISLYAKNNHGNRIFFSKDGHFTEFGHALTAKFLYEFIKDIKF